MKLFRRKKLIEKRSETTKPEPQKLGKWCDGVRGRLPYPIECSSAQKLHKQTCIGCDRQVEYASWKRGAYREIATKIDGGIDMSTTEAIVTPLFLL